MEWYEKFERLREVLGDETVFTAIKNYFTADQIEEFCDDIACQYDVELIFHE